MIATVCLLGFVGLSLTSALPSSNWFSSADPVPLFPRIDSTCPTTGLVESCENTTAVSDLCCFSYPGGMFLQVQFWDTDPVTGPSDSWTIHGLWPDNCDGTYQEDCDDSRDYDNITTLLEDQGATDTLDYMETYWVSDDESDEAFWEHEWATHGTCMNTLDPSCLPSGSATGAEAVAFFQSAVALFQTLPTYTWLENQGITPDESTTYTYEALTEALAAESGYTPALDCDGSTLYQISWYFHLEGSVIDGTWIPIDAYEVGTCPTSGIKYPPKVGATSTASLTVGLSRSFTSTGALPAKATINALVDGSAVGGLLSKGTWSTQTLATFSLSGDTDSLTMTSSEGNCGMSDRELTCGSSVTATSCALPNYDDFQVTSGDYLLLANDDKTAWCSSGTPSGETVYDVYTGSLRSVDYVLSINDKS
ncbi:RNase Gf29 [Fistulina hepatica ATCC 64428]|uniref:Ribonuclease T2-like n=1 Tax=Fistulina hepatica ATCC 64428 TaxID=1128425 RepID=A0A0D6ZYS3_9AGAR|nr:RNase Gf29 [Fistulina hepatica ATCC 64428]